MPSLDVGLTVSCTTRARVMRKTAILQQKQQQKHAFLEEYLEVASLGL